MQMELILGNEHRSLPVARAFTQETLRQLPLSGEIVDSLGELVIAVVESAIEHAYPPGEEGSIRLTILEEHGKLEILARDWGLPQDIALLEQEIHRSGTVLGHLGGSSLSSLADEVHWLGFGPQGKALHIIKWLHDTPVEDHPEVGPLELFPETCPPARDQQYSIHRMRPEEAVQVAQLIYRTYGSTYFNPDVYYPDRIAAQNARGSLLSVVAEGEDGFLVGHGALELVQDGPVGEIGQAVVDPAHRGRGILRRMEELLHAEARALDLVGWYGDAVAVHPWTQKLHVARGGSLCGVNLGILPRTASFRGIAEKLKERASCILFFHWLKQPTSRVVHAPARHRAMLATLYEGLHCSADLVEGSPPSGHGTLTVKMFGAGGTGFLRAEQIGADTVRSIGHARRALVEQSHAEAVYVELPLSDPGTPFVAEELEAEGFGFAGIAPHFSTRGDLLQLIYLVEPVSREGIQTYGDLTPQLVDYVLQEQTRVQGAR